MGTRQASFPVFAQPWREADPMSRTRVLGAVSGRLPTSSGPLSTYCGDLRHIRGHAVGHLIFSKTIQQTSVQVDVWAVDSGHAGLKGWGVYILLPHGFESHFCVEAHPALVQADSRGNPTKPLTIGQRATLRRPAPYCHRQRSG